MPLTLRTHVVVLFVVAILFVAAVATAFAVVQTGREVERSLLDELSRSSDTAALSVDGLLDSARRDLFSIGDPIRPEDLEPTVDRERIGQLLDPPFAFSGDWRALLLVDGSGQAVVARPDAPLWTGASLAGDAAFRRALETGEAQLSLTAAVDGGPAWVVPVPAAEGRPEPHFLVGVLRMDRVTDLLFANTGPETDAVLLSSDGRFVAATDPALDAAVVDGWTAWNALRVGEPAGEIAAPGSGGGDGGGDGGGGSGDGSGDGDGGSGEGATVLAAHAVSPAHGARVVVLTPSARATALQGPLVRSAVLTAGAVAAATILVGAWAAASITRPLEEMRQTSRRMRRGDLSARVEPRGAREVRDLGRDFNAMADDLQAERDELIDFQIHLEDLVAKRTAEVEDKREEMELFFYGVSHDVKSPVTAIASLAQMAEEEIEAARQEGRAPDVEAIDAYLDEVRQSSRTLQRLVAELLQFGRAGRVPPSYETVDAGRLVRGVVDEARPLAADRGVDLVDVGASCIVETDPARLERIVANLVHNAIQHMPADHADPRVRVRWRLEGAAGTEGEAREVREAGEAETETETEDDGEALVVVVEDNGRGIPRDVQSQLFRPFVHHAAAGGGEGPGAGLGLSIVKQFVESLDGEVGVESTVGHGARFTVRLPTARTVEARSR